jgi:xanthine/uracil permease
MTMKSTSWTTTTLASFQWLFFIFANTVVVPLSVGAAFELPPHEIASILRSSLIFTGVACMLQGFIGHRYPVMEGHSGVIWGLMLNLVAAAPSMGLTYTEIGGGIASGMILAGCTVLLMGVLRLLPLLHRIFTPMVMSSYLFLLTIQLILIFFTGMLSISPDGTLNVPVSLFSIVLVAFVSLLIIKGKRSIGNFAILIGMVVGWMLYLVVFPGSAAVETSGSSFMLFPLGKPNWNIGIIAITFVASMVNLSNTIASVQAAAGLYGEQPERGQYNRSFMLTGMYSIGSALLGLVSYSPYASSIGFLESTRLLDRRPFLISGGLMCLLGIVPVLGAVLATMPITVGNAVLFVAYVQLLGTSLKSLNGYRFNSITIHRLAIPVLGGVGIMFLNPAVFASLPVLLQPIISNGFIMGVLLSILMEKLIRWDKNTVTEV